MLKIWETNKGKEIKGLVFIIHGMGEHYGRYDEFAQHLNNSGYIVGMINHKGHGENLYKNPKTNEYELGYIPKDFQESLDEIKREIKNFRRKKEELPFWLMGHSFGSFIAQNIYEELENPAGLILSGSGSPSKIELEGGILLSRVLLRFKNEKDSIISKIAFGGYNKRFKGEGKSEFKWLSRDVEEVKKYEMDPKCGAKVYTSYFNGMFKVIKKAVEKGEKKKHKKKPIYIFSGGDDPVGNYGKGIKKIYKFYKNLGYEDIEMKIYKGGRHEMLNELNKKEVFKDVENWLDRRG